MCLLLDHARVRTGEPRLPGIYELRLAIAQHFVEGCLFDVSVSTSALFVYLPAYSLGCEKAEPLC